MSKLPVWARKPAHKKTVIATDLGWAVEETGELLRRVSDLPNKLKQLVEETREIENVLAAVPEQEPKEPVKTEDPVQVVEPSQIDSTSDEKSDEQADESEQKTEETKAETKAQPKKTQGAQKKSTGKKKSYYQRKKEREQQQKNAE